MSVNAEVVGQAKLIKMIYIILYGKKNIYPIILLILSIISVLYLAIIGPIIFLDENQILYIFSTSGQVIAGLYGLTLAGFTFFESKLKDILLEDNSYYDHIESLKKIYFRDITTIGIITIFSILMCIFSLSVYKVNFNNQLIINLVLTLTMCFVITSIFSIVQFSIKLLDPNKLNEIGKKIKASIEKSKSSIEKNKSDKIETVEIIRNVKNVMLVEFMKNYNELESIMIKYANELEESKSVYGFRSNKTKPKILDALKILEYNEIINYKDRKMIDMLRQYRNATVHGNDFNIDKKVLLILETYNKGMKNIFESKDDMQERIKASEDLRKNVDELIN